MRYERENDGMADFKDLSPGDDFSLDEQLYQKIPTVWEARKGSFDVVYNAVCLTRTTFEDQNLSHFHPDSQVTKVYGEFKRDKK